MSAGKTLVNGTAYTIKGGRTLVGGTGYSIKSGKTLVNGTGYSIKFVNLPDLVTLFKSVSVSNVVGRAVRTKAAVQIAMSANRYYIAFCDVSFGIYYYDGTNLSKLFGVGTTNLIKYNSSYLSISTNGTSQASVYAAGIVEFSFSGYDLTTVSTVLASAFSPSIGGRNGSGSGTVSMSATNVTPGDVLLLFDGSYYAIDVVGSGKLPTLILSNCPDTYTNKTLLRLENDTYYYSANGSNNTYGYGGGTIVALR
ncbi:MAG: hypothetical protein MJ074_06730 [Oscillospiraceae bacterium]|nr:hypothetical protein [Oscillospiraceae bacterium]